MIHYPIGDKIQLNCSCPINYYLVAEMGVTLFRTWRPFTSFRVTHDITVILSPFLEGRRISIITLSYIAKYQAASEQVITLGASCTIAFEIPLSS